MEIKVKRYIKIPMHDGIKLVADLYYPKSKEKFPLLVFRTPYERDSQDYRDSAKYFSSNGFGVLSVDVRGRGDSEGDFIPYFNEGVDGYNLMKWAVKQPWCNGEIGTYGGSYSARIQWLTAILNPPGLKTMISIVSPSDPFVESPTGIEEPMHLSWRYLVSGRTNKDNKEINWSRIYKKLPIASMVEELGFEIPDYTEGLKHQTFDDFWDKISYQNKFHLLNIPVLHISGWYDDEQIGTFINFTGMKNKSATEFSKENQSMLIGPWGHQVNKDRKLGNIDFGENSLIDIRKLELDWFKKYLMAEDFKIWKVRILVMGENKWEEYSNWPPDESREYNLTLSSKTAANSRFGDGKLSDEYTGKDYDEYIYDPENPTPFITEDTAEQIGGPDDYSPIERRDDVLVFTSDELSTDLKVIGPVEAELFVESSSPDTDFMAMLTDVWPNGYSQRLCDGVVRCRYRNGMDKVKFLDKGVNFVRINMWNTGHVFKKGHRIRLDITSSFFPKYSRNLNNGQDLAYSDKIIIAKNRIYHNKQYPSKLKIRIMEK